MTKIHKKINTTRPFSFIRLSIGVLIIAAIVSGIFVSLIVLASTQKYKGTDPVRIYLPRDIDEDALCDTLVANLGKDFGPRVYRMWSLFGDGIDKIPGSYVISPGENVKSVVARLNRGSQTPLRFTFNNVRRLQDLADKASARFTFTPEDFMAACDSILPLRGYSKTEQFPAAFLPDTYEFYWTVSAPDMVNRLVDYTDAFWTDARKTKAYKLGLSPIEVATLASIVEEESNLPDDRAQIARLYLNRLDRKMMLQADPTVKFAVGDFTLRRIGTEHLATDSPYNTYRNLGLPPGPIRLAEKQTLDIVLDAPANNYIYMCAKPDGSGRHAFAVDYDTHLRNARAYRAWLDQRGITVPAN